MTLALNSKLQIANYLLLTLVVIQSEIFWFYSAVYCLLLDSVITQKQSTLYKKIRHQPILDTQATFSNNETDSDDMKQLTSKKQYRVPRRESHPMPVLDIIRHRPSIRDELNGTTCPPVWWQKTRVKFGHKPVHGDLIIEDNNIDALSSSPNNLSSLTLDGVFNDSSMSRTRSMSDAFVQIGEKPFCTSPTSISSPILCTKNPFPITCNRSFAHVEASPPLSPVSSTVESLSKPKSKKKFKKMFKKLNNALHNIPGQRR